MSIAIVIPAFCEEAYLQRTLDSLNTSARTTSFDPEDCKVIVVVNNPTDALPEQIQENRRILDRAQEKTYAFSTHWINQTSPGLAHGVGEARKMGMNLAADLLRDPEDLIISLDADTEVAPEYIPSLLSRRLTGAGFTLNFQHPTHENSHAIGLYESYLRYLQQQLTFAGSPFNFSTIGSCLGTNVRYYQMSGGMPAKNATEDFHFLNKLRKYGEIESWHDITVFPAARASRRVFLGTGFFIAEYKKDPVGAFARLMLPPPSAFQELKKFHELVHLYDKDPVHVSREFKRNPVIDQFVQAQKLGLRLEELSKNCSTHEAFSKRVLQIFDGIQTWRLLRQLAAIQPHATEQDFLMWINR